MEIAQEILNRKGGAKLSLLSPEIKNLLNRGIIQSVNLTEWLAVDQEALIEHILPKEYHRVCLSALANLK